MNPTLTLLCRMRWHKIAWTVFFSFFIYGNNASAQCWKQVETGNNFSFGLKDDGTLWSWGGNGAGQLGIGSSITQSAPVPVGTASDWASVSANGHTMAIKTNGTLWSWGGSFSGALGTGNVTQTSPVQVGTANNWALVTTGNNYTMAIRTDGTLWAWGLNNFSQLGIGSGPQQNFPVQVGTATDWKFVVAGTRHTLAIKNNGTLWGWGSNGSGELGIGTISSFVTTPVQVGSATDWATIAAGTSFTVALKTNGTLWVWGNNGFGQLGLGHTTNQSVPVQIGADADWASVAAGNGSSTLALKTGGTLWAWGQNTNGQLGIGSTTQQNSPLQVGTGTGWTGVATGTHTLAVSASKQLWAWGLNTTSQLGIGNITQQNSPVLSGSSNYLPYLPGLGGGSATLLSPTACNLPELNGYYSFVDPTTRVRKLLAIHPGANTGNFTVVYDTSRNTNTTPLLQSNTEAATSLMGRLATVSYSGNLNSNLRVRCYYSSADSTNTSNALNAWLSGQSGAINRRWQWVQYEGNAAAMAAGQTANGFNANYRVLIPDSSGVENGIPFVEFRNITSTGTFGAIALASTYNNIPSPCWKSIETGEGSSAAIKFDGTLWAWGYNFYGQLGTGSGNQSELSPVQVGTGNNWAAISLGNSHSLGLRTDGTLWAWGRNASGELGIGNTTNQSTPVQVGTDADWASVSAGGFHTVAIKTDGSIWAWGYNLNGQLGIGIYVAQPTPVRIGTANDWKAVACSFYNTMALKTDGTLWTWGENANGQLGIGNTTNSNIPVQVAGNWASMSPARYSSMAIKTDGTLWGWGDYSNGQLAIAGLTTDQLSPVQAGSDTDWATVSSGTENIVAIKKNGTLWVWGSNYRWGVGLGDTFDQHTPIQLGTANNWTSVSASVGYYFIAIADGVIWGAGFNYFGYLGTGNTVEQPTLAQLSVSSHYPAYLPGLGGGGSTSLVQPCGTDMKGYYQLVHPLLSSKKLFAIHPNGNAGGLTVMYDTSRNTNSSPLLQSDVAAATSLMGRLVTVTYSGTIGAGMRVRYYYDATDSTNASNALDSWTSSHPGSVKQWQWIKYEGDAAAMVASQTASGFSGAYTRLIPDSSGIEDGISFVEFWNINSFSTFGAMAIANVNIILPIGLTDFTASLQGDCKVVKLNWSTEFEQNSRNFIIQRSADGSNWADIAAVAAAGNSGITKRYSYLDASVKSSSTYYYRLQMNDIDGLQKNSRTLGVRLNCGAGNFLVYPNPARDVITIQSPADGGQRLLTIHNTTGQRIHRMVVNPGSVQTLDVSGWAHGIYLIVISEKGKTVYSEKIIKQ